MEVDYPNNLRISTSTATCTVNSFVYLSLVYRYLKISEHIIYMEYADEIPKGTNPGKPKSKKASDRKKLFYNQITIIVKPNLEKNIYNNVKLFNNGAVSMTGIKKNEGQDSIRIVLDQIKDIKGVVYSNIEKGYGEMKHEYTDIQCDFCEKHYSVHNIKKTKCEHNICKLCIKNDELDKTTCVKCERQLVEDALANKAACKVKDYKIVLINSDYYIGFNINRDALHEILHNKYQIYSSYEPCIYPGVNSKYYWNEDYLDNEYPGKCMCSVFCNGKGNGKGNGNCKKITVSIFQSGSIIITGARNHVQILTAYNFINKVINNDIDIIKKDTNKLIKNEKQKVVKLNRCNVKNFPDENARDKIEAYLIKKGIKISEKVDSESVSSSGVLSLNS